MSAIPVPHSHLRSAVKAALREDLYAGDVTTAALFPQDFPAHARILAQEDLTVAGMEVARCVFTEIDSFISFNPCYTDSDVVQTGSVLLILKGSARSLLMGERVALNFLQHLSGIATLTTRFCQAVGGYTTKILDTRKTTPGLRMLEKWAVRLGGGLNHRSSLGDGILIKDNHLDLLQSSGITLTQACRTAREQGPHGLRVCVEIRSLDQVRQALEGKADVILLDNMGPLLVRQAAAMVKGHAVLEVSGGVTLENVREMASAGADFISIGALTHSAPAVDINMEFFIPPNPKQKTPPRAA